MLRQGIAWHRQQTWRWQDIAGRHRTPTTHAETRTRSTAYLAWLARLWSHRRIRARHLATVHPAIAHLALWICIHNGEGAWDSSTGNGYYGGLQMSYGWGGLVTDAAQLSPYEQMRAAETGYRTSGYSTRWLEGQWPNTSPPCLGLA